MVFQPHTLLLGFFEKCTHHYFDLLSLLSNWKLGEGNNAAHLVDRQPPCPALRSSWQSSPLLVSCAHTPCSIHPGRPQPPPKTPRVDTLGTQELVPHTSPSHWATHSRSQAATGTEAQGRGLHFPLRWCSVFRACACTSAPPTRACVLPRGLQSLVALRSTSSRGARHAGRSLKGGALSLCGVSSRDLHFSQAAGLRLRRIGTQSTGVGRNAHVHWWGGVVVPDGLRVGMSCGEESRRRQRLCHSLSPQARRFQNTGQVSEGQQVWVCMHLPEGPDQTSISDFTEGLRLFTRPRWGAMSRGSCGNRGCCGHGARALSPVGLPWRPNGIKFYRLLRLYTGIPFVRHDKDRELRSLTRFGGFENKWAPLFESDGVFSLSLPLAGSYSGSLSLKNKQKKKNFLRTKRQHIQ